MHTRRLAQEGGPRRRPHLPWALAVLLAVASAALGPGAPTYAQTTATVDQAQEVTTAFKIARGAESVYPRDTLAQTFIARRTGLLEQVDLHLGVQCDELGFFGFWWCYLPGDLNVEILEATGPTTTGAVLATAVLPESALGTAPYYDSDPPPGRAWRSVRLSTPVPVVDGARYAIAVSGTKPWLSDPADPRGVSGVFEWSGAWGDPYPDGASPQPFTEGFDFAFRTYVAGPPDTTPPTVGLQQTPPPPASGWHAGSVQVTISAADEANGSGVEEIVYRASGAQSIAPTTVAGPSATFAVSASGETTISYFARDNADNAGPEQVAVVRIDTSAPTTTAATFDASGDPISPNANGWFRQPVTVALTCTDDLAGCAGSAYRVDGGELSAYAGPFAVGGDAAHTVTFSSTDKAGNAETAKSQTIRIDTTAPVVSGTPDRAADHDGWYSHPLNVGWSGADALSGVAACAAATRYGGPDDARATVSGSCTDEAGNTGTGAFAFGYDATAPAIAFTGNKGTYLVDETVRIACTATDATSGIDAGNTTCPAADGDAYAFPLGGNSLTATARDRAGNAGTATATFTVTSTYPSLRNLVDRFVANGGLANALNQKLAAAEHARTPGARAGALQAFANLVEAQQGKALTAEHAGVLERLAQALAD